MIPLSVVVSKASAKPLIPTAEVKAKLAVVRVVDPASLASEQPSPSESLSNRFGVPSPSVSMSTQENMPQFCSVTSKTPSLSSSISTISTMPSTSESVQPFTVAKIALAYT